MQTNIQTKLSEALQPTHLEVINESDQHNVPPGSESHFKVVIVSETFADQTLLQRHQAINQLLKTELAESVHALSLQTFTPAEWTARSESVEESPPCLGGSKVE